MKRWRRLACLLGTGVFLLPAALGLEDSGAIGASGSFVFEFPSEGTFDYFCRPHPWMKGTVVVHEGAPKANATENVTIEDFLYRPSQLEVRPGTRVVWTNRDETIHTVSPGARGASDGLAAWQVGIGVLSLAGIVGLLWFILRDRRTRPDGPPRQP